MPDRNPRPVYLVPGPPPPTPLGEKIGRLIAAVIIVGVLIVAATAFLPLVGVSDPLASFRATDAPRQGTSSSAAPTVDTAAVSAAAQDALNRLQGKLNAKDRTCSSLDGAAYTKCSREWDALSKTYDQLSTCLDGAETLPAVKTCTKRAGL